MAEAMDGHTVTNKHGGKQSHVAGRYDLIPPRAEKLLAEVLAFGDRKYPADESGPNWHRITVEEHINHLRAHINAWQRGDRSEYHLANALCRAAMALEVSVHRGGWSDYWHPEMEATDANESNTG